MAFNPRIPELPELTVIDSSMIIAVYDYETDTTYFAKVSVVLPPDPSNDYRWDSLTIYAIGNIVSYTGRLWESLTNGNLDNVPFEGTNWTEVSKAASGLVRWAAGVQTTTDACVISNITGQDAIYIITVTTPYNSIDFETELKAGTWRLLAETKFDTQAIGGGLVTIDAKAGKELTRKSISIAGGNTWSLVNDENFERADIFVELTGGGPWAQVFTDMISNNGNWDIGTKTWNPIEAGKYKVTIEWDGTLTGPIKNYLVTISNLFG